MPVERKSRTKVRPAPDEARGERSVGGTSTDDQLARLARGVSHPLRLRILRLLLERGQCVCGDLVDALPRAQSTVSQHLKVLKECGLIRGELEPPRVCYCVDVDGVRELKKLIEDL